MYRTDENPGFAQNSQLVDESLNDESSIAIIGMNGRFPGAKDVNAFWANLKAGVESIHFFTDDELRASPYVNDVELEDSAYVKARGILENIDLFDADFFGINPREAKIMDPQLRVFLESAFNALEDAGYDPFTHADPIGVFAGASTSTYLLRMLQYMPRGISNELQLLLYNSGNCLATYISYKLGLKGPSVNVQTACSTSLIAAHFACQSLLSGECDMALAGGVSIDVRQRSGYLYEPSGIASPDGHCRAFDAEAAGCVAGSGVGVVVLKRLSEALADRDNIYAVIKASAANNDGAAKIGFTAPSIQGQADVISTAIELAHIDPETIEYIECHGTGTNLGDPIEVAALSQALQQYTEKRGYCSIGSVKTNVGHLDAAAGVTSLIKAVLAVKHAMVPPSVNYNKPNPKFDLAHSPLIVNTQLREWNKDQDVRRAGVSSFGIGGSNAHVIVEQAPHLASESKPVGLYMMPLSARTPTALRKLCSSVADFLVHHPEQSLANVAYTLQVGRAAWEYRHCITAESADDARRMLEAPIDPKHIAADSAVVFLFPGQGTQYSGMAAGLYKDNPVFRHYVDLSLKHLSQCGNTQLVEAVRDSFNGIQNPLNNTTVVQTALFIVEYAFAKTLMKYGVKPAAMIGHSLGEYVAACISGVITLEQCLPLIVTRGQLIDAIPPGAMLAVTLAEEQVRELLPQDLAVATVNSPSLCVVSGPVSSVVRLELILKEMGVTYKRLAVSHAFHSRMMDPAVDPFYQSLSGIDWQQAQIPYVSNVTGKWISKGDLAQAPDYWTRHMCGTVRFADGLSEILEHAKILVEVGPGFTLSGIVKQHPSFGGEHVLVQGMRRQDSSPEDLHVLFNCLGSLWSNGADVHWEQIYSGALPRRVSLPPYPFERKRYWMEGDESGSAAILEAKPIPQQRQSDVSKWFYAPCWKQQAPVSIGNDKNHKDQTLVICGDDSLKQTDTAESSLSVIQVWCSGSQDSPSKTFSIDIEDTERCDLLFQNLADRGNVADSLVYIVPRSSSANEGEAHGIRRNIKAIINLVRSVNNHGNSTPVHMFILTQCAFSVTGDEPVINTGAAALLGLCRVVSQEFPSVSSRILDLDSPAWNTRKFLIQNEMNMNVEGSVVAYRNGRRWGMTYEQLTVHNETTHQTLIKAEGTYVITGGLGNIGLIFADYLVQQGCTNVVLVSTTEFPGRETWEEYIAGKDADPVIKAKLQTLRQFDALGVNIDIVKANVADQVQMRAVVADITAQYGVLNGIIHCAGYVKPDCLQPLDQTHDELIQLHLTPKVTGTKAIESAITGLKLDFCLLVSSISTLLGGIGYGAYSVANCYLDSFVAMKNLNSSHTAWMSVDFDGWTFTDTTHSYNDRYQHLAELAITPSEGSQVVKALFSLGIAGQVIVSTAELQQRIKELRINNCNEKRDLNRKVSAYHERPTLTVPYVAPRTELESAVVEIMEQALHISGIGVDDNFFELGGDSLMGIQILSHVKKNFEIEIPVKAMFEHPAPSQLAVLIEQKMVDEISHLSDEEAEALANQITMNG